MPIPHSPDVVRRNFRLDLFGAICAGMYAAVLLAFMPVVVRRMGGSSLEVALVVAAPFIGHLLSPIGIYLLSGLPAVRVVAATATASRTVFIAGVLVATTPLMLALSTLSFWVITIANVAAYTAVMAAIYPQSDRAQAMGKVRIGASVASIASAAVAGLLIDVVPATLVFAGVAILSLPGSIAFFWIRDEGRAAPPPRRPAGVIAREIWSDQRYRRLLVANSVFGLGNLMNVAIAPIMLVDHFDAPNSFVGALAALSSLIAVGAYLFWGRMIDRGSSLQLSSYMAAACLLTPLTYMLAPSVWFLLPLAIVQGVVIAGFEITYHTNLVEAAPPGRIIDYATAQSFLLGIRGTIAPFAASALMGVLEPRMVLAISVTVMLVGWIMYSRAVRGYAPRPEVAPVVETAPAS